MSKPIYKKITDSKELADALSNTNNVILRGVGRFEMRDIPPRTFLSGITKTISTSSARRRIRFVPYGKLKKICKQ